MSRYHNDRHRKRRFSGSDDETTETRFSINPRSSQRSQESRHKDSGRDRLRDEERRDSRKVVDDRRRDRDRGADRDRNRRESSRDRQRRDDTRYRDSRKDDSRRDRRSPSPRAKRNRDSRSPMFKKSKSPEEAKLFDRILDPNYKKKETTNMEIEDIEMSPVPLKDEEEIKTFTLDYDFGPARPAGKKFVTPSPEESPHSTPIVKEEAEEGEIEEEEEPVSAAILKDVEDELSSTFAHDLLSDDEQDDIEKYNFTPDDEDWELMSEEDKKLFKEAMEKRAAKKNQDLIDALPVYYPGIHGCQHIHEYKILNTIAEGTYGEVFRGKNTRTDEIVALKRFKLEHEREGFPITALREINMLLKAGSHENIVNVKEILAGDSKNEVYMAMEFVEHDTKSLIEKMKAKNQRFKTGQQKTLMLQLLSGMEFIHRNWILHRDLKTSNLLISHSGCLKIADFGMAREFGDRPQKLTPLVVTLWYRSPELLLNPKDYSTPVDMWSVGCIMAEFILMRALMPGENEPDQVRRIFEWMGTPNVHTWPDLENFPLWQRVHFDKYPAGELKKKFRGEKLLNESGFALLNGLLTLNPSKRITAEEALNHQWFEEHPVAVPREQLPKYPAKSELNVAPPKLSRKEQLEESLKGMDPEQAELLRQLNVRPDQVKPSGFQLKF